MEWKEFVTKKVENNQRKLSEKPLNINWDIIIEGKAIDRDGWNTRFHVINPVE